MPDSIEQEPLARARSLARDWSGPLLAFAGVVAISLEGGGYDAIVRDGIGIAVWAVLAVGVLCGVLPLARTGRAAWIVLGLLAALTAWIALGLTWTESTGRTFDEVARMLTYLGVLGLAIALQGPGGSRRMLAAVGAAIALVSGLALLSRLHPAWFPPNDLAAAQPSLQGRLNYPLNYWNAVAAMIAIGAPIVLALAAGARHRLTRAASAAALPLMALASYFTFSRGGAIAGIVGVIAFIAVWRGRVRAIPAVFASGLGSAVLVFLAHRRADLDAGLDTAAAHSQGDEMILITLVVCAAVGAATILGERLLAGRSLQIPTLSPSRRWIAAAAVGVVVVVAALAAGVPSKAADSWEEFKDPGGAGAGAGRFEAASGNGRYQYWGAAIDAFESSPVIGIGPGSYQLWWTRNGSTPGTIRDAHSLYLETLGELGAVGAALLVALIGFLLYSGFQWARTRSPGEGGRGAGDPLASGALAAMVAFAIAAATDWLWEVPAIPVVVLVIGAAILAGSGQGESGSATRGAWPARARAAIALGMIAAAVVLAVDRQGERLLRESAEDLARGDFQGALEAAEAAEELPPAAAQPAAQQAAALELQAQLAKQTGDPSAESRFESAVAAAREATDREPTNWQTWMTLGQVEQRRGNVEATLDAYARARSLNPLSGNLAYLDELLALDPPPPPRAFREGLPKVDRTLGP